MINLCVDNVSTAAKKHERSGNQFGIIGSVLAVYSIGSVLAVYRRKTMKCVKLTVYWQYPISYDIGNISTGL